MERTPDYSQEQVEHRLLLREKLLRRVKGSVAYRSYVEKVPKESRAEGDLSTPRVADQCSKNAFDKSLKQWQMSLEQFDPGTAERMKSFRENKEARRVAKVEAQLEQWRTRKWIESYVSPEAFPGEAQQRGAGSSARQRTVGAIRNQRGLKLLPAHCRRHVQTMQRRNKSTRYRRRWHD